MFHRVRATDECLAILVQTCEALLLSLARILPLQRKRRRVRRGPGRGWQLSISPTQMQRAESNSVVIQPRSGCCRNGLNGANLGLLS